MKNSENLNRIFQFSIETDGNLWAPKPFTKVVLFCGRIDSTLLCFPFLVRLWGQCAQWRNLDYLGRSMFGTQRKLIIGRSYLMFQALPQGLKANWKHSPIFAILRVWVHRLMFLGKSQSISKAEAEQIYSSKIQKQDNRYLEIEAEWSPECTNRIVGKAKLYRKRTWNSICKYNRKNPLPPALIFGKKNR